MASVKVLKISSEGIAQENQSTDDISFNSYTAALAGGFAVTSGVSITNNISFNAATDTIGGIQNQNLVDKTASETISADWTVATGYNLTLVDAPTSDTDATNKAYVDAAVRNVEWQDSVLDKDLTAPPGSPSVGDRYIIASPATGDWEDEDDNIAEWDGVQWIFTTVSEGFAASVDDENIVYIYNGTAWVVMASFFNHNSLSGLQGGTSAQYYHLTSAEHTFLTGVVTGNGVRAVDVPYTAGENLTAANAVYVSGDNQVSKAIASGAGTDRLIGFALATVSAAASVEIREAGIIAGALSGATANTRYYLSASVAGELQSSPPTGSGNRIVQAGYAKNATDLNIQIQSLGIRS